MDEIRLALSISVTFGHTYHRQLMRDQEYYQRIRKHYVKACRAAEEEEYQIELSGY